MSTIQSLFRFADRISPFLAGRLAEPFFFHLGRRRQVQPGEREVLDEAERDVLDFEGERVARYRWRGGARTALLVHGWQGSAAQFAPIVRELRGEGFTVIAFDAPAHGASTGRRTNALQLRRLVARVAADSPPDLVVAHSIGALSAVAAIADGVPTRAAVLIAPADDFEAVLDIFAAQVGIGPDARAVLRQRIVRRAARSRPADLDELTGTRRPLPAGIPVLLVHDPADRRVPFAAAERLRDILAERADLMPVPGAGHSRILAAEETLDAVVAFVAPEVLVGVTG